jgi:hypothetical protein
VPAQQRRPDREHRPPQQDPGQPVLLHPARDRHHGGLRARDGLGGTGTRGLTRFLASDVFGPYRHGLLDASRAALAQAAHDEHAEKIKALQKAISDANTKGSRLIRTLEVADDLDPDFIRDINRRRAELRVLRDDLEGQLAAAQQQGQSIHNPALLDHLPVTDIDLEGMPDDVSRRLFEALRLEIRCDPAARTARCSITLTGETIDAVSRITEEATARGSSRCDMRPAGRASDTRDGLCGAPRRIRTFAPGSGGQGPGKVAFMQLEVA